MSENFSNELFASAELIPAIVQDASTLQVLMLGWMNRESYELTLKTKLCTFFSRSRQKLWVKGESSRNFLHVQEIFYDCDNDCLLVKANPDGPTCHTGNTSCFYRKIELENDDK